MNDWPLKCPNNQSQNNTYYYEILSCQTDYNHPSKLLSLLDESTNAVVLDSRASKSVCGESSFNIFQENCKL